MTQIIDVAGLVADGCLDLNAVCRRAHWQVEDCIAAYTACVYGPDDAPGEVEVVLEAASAYGLTVYRWCARDDGGTHETGPLTLEREEAVEAGEEYARVSDESPDADDLIRRIVDTGYFGAADADDIRAVCEAATAYSQGYLLLPAGGPCGEPVGRLWTTHGYLQCRHVRIAADHGSPVEAAYALLRAVEAEMDADGDE